MHLLKIILPLLIAIQLCAGEKLSFEWQRKVASKEIKNVLDYYHLLPDIYFDPEDITDQFSTAASRDSVIKVKDISNGYIRFNKSSEITLYRDRKNKRDIIAIQIWKSGAGSNVPEGNRLLFFDNTQNRWTSLDSLLPENYSFEEIYEKYNENGIERFPYFDLPQHGTSILIRDEETETVLDTLFWNGSSFYVKEPK